MTLRLGVVVLLAAVSGPATDPHLLDASKRPGRYYDRIDLRGWSRDGALFYVAQASGDDVECGSNLSWRTRVLVVRGSNRADTFRVEAEGRQQFETRKVEGSLQAARVSAGCSAEDPAVREYDAAAPVEQGAARLGSTGPLTPVCRIEELRGKCAAPDGKSTLEIERSQGKADKRGCRREQLRYAVRKADGSAAELLAVSASVCAREELGFQASWSADSTKVATAANAHVRGRSAAAMQEFARLDVLDVPSGTGR